MKHILLIEDDQTLSRNIREALQEEGFSVDVVYDGSIAEKMLRRNPYDCVVLDVNLPGKNGYEVCANFRAYNDHTPVLMLTAFGELDDKIEGFQKGADDYLTKPFYMKELLFRVLSLLKRKGFSSMSDCLNKVIMAGDITIDTGNKTVKRQETLIELTPREYQILIQLVKAKGDIVPKEALIKEIWGTTLDVNTNTIEVYINFLRRKIDKPFGKESIKTKIGFGYYFVET